MYKVAKFVNSLPHYMNYNELFTRIKEDCDYAIEAQYKDENDYVYYVLVQIDEDDYMTISEYKQEKDSQKTQFVTSSNEFNKLSYNKNWIPYDKKNLQSDLDKYLKRSLLKKIKVLKK